MKNILFTVLAILSSTILQAAGQPFVTVGADNDNVCDYHNIQEAIDGGLSNTIRIASNKLYQENVVIDDRDLTLTGGYADCTGANNNITDLSRAEIYGDGGSVVLVTGNNEVRDVAIRNLHITGGNIGLNVNASVQLNVSDVKLVDNTLTGVFLDDGDVTSTFTDVFIALHHGPGVACIGANNSIHLEGNSMVTNNLSSSDGGGLIISAGCTAHLDAPTIVTNNTANDNGAGIYVSDGAIVNLNGAQIVGNSADVDGDGSGDGGAVYVEGEFSIVNAVNVKFEGNSASRGGAVAVADKGRFTSYAANTVSNPCVTPGECTSFKGNSVSTFGGVFYASTEGQILAMHAMIRGTGAPADGLIALANGGAHIEIEGSMIVKNGGEDLPADDLFNVAGLLDNTTRITLDHVTIADNEITDSVFRNSNGNFSLTSSIVREEVDVSSETNSVSHTFECAIVNETGSFSAGPTVTVDDPQFIGANNYHIKPTSPAVDYCYDAASLTVELGYDIDLEGRNYDDPNMEDLNGTFDIGADEYRWDNDLIFMNGFEEAP